MQRRSEAIIQPVDFKPCRGAGVEAEVADQLVLADALKYKRGPRAEATRFAPVSGTRCATLRAEPDAENFLRRTAPNTPDSAHLARRAVKYLAFRSARQSGSHRPPDL